MEFFVFSHSVALDVYGQNEFLLWSQLGWPGVAFSYVWINNKFLSKLNKFSSKLRFCNKIEAILSKSFSGSSFYYNL